MVMAMGPRVLGTSWAVRGNAATEAAEVAKAWGG